MIKLLKITVLSSLILLAGCSYNVAYDPSYVHSNLSNASLPSIDGSVLIYTEKLADETIYSQAPTSLTGGATKLNVKVGYILKQISIETFKKAFKGDVKHSNDRNESGDYLLIIEPKIKKYEYQYNQLKNLGFAITPEVSIDIVVSLYDKQNKRIFEKTYTTGGYVSGETYFVSLSPHETVNKTIHLQITDLLIQVVNDIKEAV